MLTKYCRDRVQVGDDDLRQAFEAKYGEKVEVRVLMYPHDMLKAVYKIYEQVRHTDDESEAERKARDEEFERAARSQPNAQLAANGGKVPPISRYSGDDEVERVAFSLRPGEVSSIIHTKEALLILKCIKRIGPDRTKLFENEREALKREVFDQKIQKEIGEVFKELSAKAQPVRYLRESESMADLERAVRQELQTGPLPGKPGGK
jgi:foldase protein PrsA